MFKIVLTLACLAYASHGSPSQPSFGAQRLQHQSHVLTQPKFDTRSLKVDSDDHAGKDVVEEHVHLSDGSPGNLLRSLALLLLTHKSGGEAFYPSGSRLGHATPSSLRCPGRCSHAVGKDLGEFFYDGVASVGRLLTQSPAEEQESAARVSNAVQQIERDAAMLDVETDTKQHVKKLTMVSLLGMFGLACGSPFFLGEEFVEVLLPSLAALAAMVGASAEYGGKVAVTRGKQVGAISLQAAAEAEMYFAQAERASAIISIGLGVSAAFAAVALVVPNYLAEYGIGPGELSTEILLICPIISILSAAVSALANQETGILSDRAVNLGARRFSSAREVGRTWLSASEQISAATKTTKSKWRDFAVGIIPAPAIGLVWPGDLAEKCVVVSAVAALQAAVSLGASEYSLSKAMESVGTKTRSAAVTDTYANQGMKQGAILPYTSALGVLCIAVTVCAVEFTPFLGGLAQEAVVGAIFPGLGCLVAAAASISRARCEENAEAATQAATLLSENRLSQEKGPFRSTAELLRYTFRNIRKQVKRGSFGLVFNLLKTVGRTLTFGLLFNERRGALKW